MQYLLPFLLCRGFEGIWPIELQRGMVWLTKRCRARTKTNQRLSFGPGTNRRSQPFLCLAERERESSMATSKLQALWNHPAGPKTSESTRLSFYFYKSSLCRLSDCNLQIKNMCFLCLFPFARFWYFVSDFLRSCLRVSVRITFTEITRLDPRRLRFEIWKKKPREVTFARAEGLIAVAFADIR